MKLSLSLFHSQTQSCRYKPSSSLTFSLSISPDSSSRCILLVKRWKVFLILYGQKYHRCTTKFLVLVVRLSIYVTHFPFYANIWYTIYQLLCFIIVYTPFYQCHTIPSLSIPIILSLPFLTLICHTYPHFHLKLI